MAQQSTQTSKIQHLAFPDRAKHFTEGLELFLLHPGFFEETEATLLKRLSLIGLK